MDLFTCADLIRLDTLLCKFSLLIEAASIRLRHFLVPLGLFISHSPPRLLQVLHDLLCAPLIVHDLENFALLLRKENEGA